MSINDGVALDMETTATCAPVHHPLLLERIDTAHLEPARRGLVHTAVHT